jgi:hypothetical protein
MAVSGALASGPAMRSSASFSLMLTDVAAAMTASVVMSWPSAYFRSKACLACSSSARDVSVPSRRC